MSPSLLFILFRLLYSLSPNTIIVGMRRHLFCIYLVTCACFFLLGLPDVVESLSSLQSARELNATIPQDSISGEVEGAEFWTLNSFLLKEAWREWEESLNLPELADSVLLDEEFYGAFNLARHGNEDILRKTFVEVAPAVYRCQLFNPSMIKLIREHIDKASFESRIPTRRPNGMNRFGLILNSEVDGSVDLKEFRSFYLGLVDQYIRPIGQLLFPEYVGDGDADFSYAFTIRYKEGEDTTLKEHSDASLITLNVNLNTPDEIFGGSNLYFVDETGQRHNVTFSPGMALVHLGRTRHASFPIESGGRTNMIVWLFGKDGYVRIAPYSRNERLSRQPLWAKPKHHLTSEEL